MERGFSHGYCPMGVGKSSKCQPLSAGSTGTGIIVLRPRLRHLRESEVQPATGLPSAEVHARGTTLPLWIPPDWNEWKFKLFVLECCIDRHKIRSPASKGSTLPFSTPFTLESMGKQVHTCRRRFLSSMVPDGK